MIFFAKSYLIFYGFYTIIINFEVILTYVNQFGSAQPTLKSTFPRAPALDGLLCIYMPSRSTRTALLGHRSPAR